MQICGGCGLAGTRENHWQPVDHKCPRWNYEYSALVKLYNVVAAHMEGGAMTKEHVKMVLKECAEVRQKAAEADGR